MNKTILESMRRVMLRRIVENLDEADVTDSRGNIVISKDLKIRHVPSQFEYTVADVIHGRDGIQIVLRSPESSRFEPGTDLVISEDEFEKEYEVK
ncbi:MAG: hypothetical protein CMA72_06950 [Euryarchaeota archaeon]|nr:hypothetical protein [Euryarchaeota archaeon]|tara:strand:+ start:21924 stop:22208 length:285 start_codon:yes stop_codon:yes gene_type:complete